MGVHPFASDGWAILHIRSLPLCARAFACPAISSGMHCSSCKCLHGGAAVPTHTNQVGTNSRPGRMAAQPDAYCNGSVRHTYSVQRMIPTGQSSGSSALVSIASDRRLLRAPPWAASPPASPASSPAAIIAPRFEAPCRLPRTFSSALHCLAAMRTSCTSSGTSAAGSSTGGTITNATAGLLLRASGTLLLPARAAAAAAARAARWHEDYLFSVQCLWLTLAGVVKIVKLMRRLGQRFGRR